MAKSTPRMGLYLPGGGSLGTNVPDETADIDKLNNNFELIDEAVGAKMVTSSTRPIAPFDGQLIFEGDTQRLKIFDEDANEWREAVVTSTVAWNAVTGKPASFPSSWAEVSGKPASFPSTWGTVSGKPATFAPTIGGAANQAVAGNDARLTNARTPTAHTHDRLTGDGNTLVVGSDGEGPRLYSPKALVYDRTYSNAPNMYVTSAGTIGRGTGGIAADTVTSAAYNRNGAGSNWFGMWMNSSLQIMRNTSSRRYKENIVPRAIDPARVLALEVVEYDRIGGGHEVGMIAEQVHEHLPEIVTWFAELDEDNEPIGEEQIDGIRYDLLAVMQQAVLIDQERRIRALEEKLEALL